MSLLVPEARKMNAAGRMAVRFCYDHNKIQESADPVKMGILPGEILPSAKYSPDMHKPIEHAWAQLKKEVEKQLLQPRARELTAADAQALVRKCFFGLSRAGIFKDVCSLPVTYCVIAGERGSSVQGPDGADHTGTGGDWPPREYR